MTLSHWQRARNPTRLDRDVLVVGGGVCGLGAAVALERRGVEHAVVERHAVGSGASGRNAGFLMRGIEVNYALAVDRLGHDLARLAWEWTERNLAALRELGVADLPGYRPTPSCLLALQTDERVQLERSVELLREDGFAADLVRATADTLWTRARPLLGLLNPGDATCDPCELLALLRRASGSTVLEGNEVASIARDGPGMRVRTSAADVRCRRVLLCVNAYAPLLVPALEGIVTPRRGQMLALAPAGRRLNHAYYVNHGSEYLRQTPDGTIVVGGCRTRDVDAEVGYEDRVTPRVQAAIESFARRVLGDPLDVLARWSGTMGFSPDGLPLIGPVPGEWDEGSVWFCGGFTGHGMSIGFQSAHAAVSAMLDGAPTPFPLSRVLAR